MQGWLNHPLWGGHGVVRPPLDWSYGGLDHPLGQGGWSGQPQKAKKKKKKGFWAFRGGRATPMAYEGASATPQTNRMGVAEPLP